MSAVSPFFQGLGAEQLSMSHQTGVYLHRLAVFQKSPLFHALPRAPTGRGSSAGGLGVRLWRRGACRDALSECPDNGPERIHPPQPQRPANQHQDRFRIGPGAAATTGIRGQNAVQRPCERTRAAPATRDTGCTEGTDGAGGERPRVWACARVRAQLSPTKVPSGAGSMPAIMPKGESSNPAFPQNYPRKITPHLAEMLRAAFPPRPGLRARTPARAPVQVRAQA